LTEQYSHIPNYQQLQIAIRTILEFEFLLFCFDYIVQSPNTQITRAITGERGLRGSPLGIEGEGSDDLALSGLLWFGSW